MKRNKLIKILMCSFLFTFNREWRRAQRPSIPGKYRKYGHIKKNIHLHQAKCWVLVLLPAIIRVGHTGTLL